MESSSGGDGAKLEEWERQFAELIAAKEEQELKSLAEKKAAAERALDIFYDELTDKKAQKQAQNREHEEFSTAGNCQNPYERVMELIGPTISSSSSSSSETQIMHSLLVRLKQQPPPSCRGETSSSEKPPPPPQQEQQQAQEPHQAQEQEQQEAPEASSSIADGGEATD